MTKTVDGVCAECWGVKDRAAVRVGRRPRTEPLALFDWDDPADVLLALGLVVAVIAAIVYAL